MQSEKTTETETWFEVTSLQWGPSIRAVQVERSTESSVWINGRRSSRSSSYSRYFPTWDEAVEVVRRRMKITLGLIEGNLDTWRRALDRLDEADQGENFDFIQRGRTA